MAEIISGTKRKAAHAENTAPPKVAQLQIDRVIGLSPPNSGAVACCPCDADLLCYPAGSFAVVYSTSAKQQLRLLRSTTSNAALSRVTWSATGEQIAAGESGSSPSIFIWDWSSSKCLHELKGHKNSIASLRFSPDDKLLLTAGGANDGQLCIWDWRAGCVLWRQTVASELSSAVFTEDSSCVLAVGKNIFKAWSVNHNLTAARAKGGSFSTSNSLSLTPRPVTLRQLQRSTFVDVCMAPCLPSQPTGNNGVYALVDSGVLVLMRPTGRTIDKSVNLQVKSAFALAAAPTQVATACSQGVVRLFSSKTLTFRATLPRFVANGQGAAAGDFPDARGCSFTSATEDQLVVVYADMSMLVWNIQDITKVTCMLSLAAHGSCVWDVCPISAPAPGGNGTLTQQFVPSRFATCAADGTVRLWNLSADAAPGTGRLLAASVDDPGKPSAQLRCMRISPDGRHICVGDQAGNLRAFDSITYKQVVQQDAHDDEVLCLDYSPLGPSSSCLVASGSRDMLIHIFDAQHGYELLETLDDHTAAVTGVRFTGGGKGIVSCGADRSIIFRVLGGKADGSTGAYHIETLPHSVLYDLAVDPLDQYVFTTGQDGLLRQWDVTSGNLQRTLTPEAGAGEPIKLYIDPGGVVLICCHADGCLRLYHLGTGQLLWRAWGHSEMVAAASLSPDFTRMLSVGGDGCVIVWLLPEQLVQEVQTAVIRVAAAKMRLETSGKQNTQHHTKQVPVEPTASAGASRQQRAWEASPAPAAVSQGQHVDSCEHGGYATPPTSSIRSSSSTGAETSDSGVCSTLLRVRQGKPLVSTDKLPKWARSPTADGPMSPPANLGDGAAQQQQQAAQSKWLVGRPAAQGKWQMAQEPFLHSDVGSPIVSKMDKEVPCRQLSLESNSSTMSARNTSEKFSDTNEVQGNIMDNLQLQSSVWTQDDDMVVTQDWDDSSLVQYEGQGDADDGAVAADESLQAIDEEFTAQLPQQTPNVEQSARVVRDLFKEHFSSLGGADPSTQQRQSHEFRQSLSAMFKAERASLGGLPLRSQVLSNAGSVPVGKSSGLEVETAAPQMQLSALPAADTTNVALQQQQQLDAAVPEAGHTRINSTGDEQLMAGQVSPKRRWRHGKMDAELAGMRDRLANLQALYQQQMLQRQLSPRRGKSCSRTDDHAQLAAQLATQQEGCSSEPGGGAPKKSRIDEDSAATHVHVNSPTDKVCQAGASQDASAAVGGVDASSSMPAEGASGMATQPAAADPSKDAASFAASAATSATAPPLPPGTVPAAALNRVAGKPAPYAATVIAAPAALRPADTRQQAAMTGTLFAANDKHVGSGEPAAPGPVQPAAPGPVQPAAAADVGGDAAHKAVEEPTVATTATSTVQPAAAGLPPASPAMQAMADDCLLAQLLSDSPGLPSPQPTSSPARSEGTAAGAAAATPKWSALNPLCVAAGFHAGVGDSPGSQKGVGSSAGSGSSSTSPTMPAACWLQSQSTASPGDSMYRVSIGTSIAAAGGVNSYSSSMHRAAGGGASSPTRLSWPLKVPQAVGVADGVAGVQQTNAQPSESISIPATPVAAAPVAAADSGDTGEVSSEQQQGLDPESSSEAVDAADVSCIMLSGEEARHGVTITPHGQHVVWPGWGAEGAWDGMTPSPVNPSMVPKLQAALADEAPGRVEEAATDQSAAHQAVDADATGQAHYWVQKNPCYDMTPLGSTPGSVITTSNGKASCIDSIPFDNITDALCDSSSEQHSATDSEVQQCGSESASTQQCSQILQQSVEPEASSCGDIHSPETKQCAGQHEKKLNDEVQVQVQDRAQQPSQLQEPEQQQHFEHTSQGHQLQKPAGLPLTQQQQLAHIKHMQQQQQPASAHLAAPSDASLTSMVGGSTPISPTAGFGHTPSASGAYSSPATPSTASSSKGNSKGQTRREKAAAKAALKAAKAAAAAVEHDGPVSPSFSSPGSSMMSLLQRIKRTMPSLKSRPSSSAGGSSASGGLSCGGAKASSTYSPDKGPCPRLTLEQVGGESAVQQKSSRQQSSKPQHTAEPASGGPVDVGVLGASGGGPVDVGVLGAWMRESGQHPKWKRESDNAQAIAVSANDIKLDMAQGLSAYCDAGNVQHSQQKLSAAQQQEAATPTGAVTPETAVATSENSEPPSAVKSRTAAQLAASVEQFKQSVHEMQQLWLQLQSLSFDEQDACELQQLLTPPHKAALAATTGGGSNTNGRAAGPPAVLRSAGAVVVQPGVVAAATDTPTSGLASDCYPQQQQSAEPVQLVKQMLQEELLHSIWDLHATVTGGVGGGASRAVQLQTGAQGSPPRTPLHTNCSTSPLHPWQLHSTYSAQQQQQQLGIGGYGGSPLGPLHTPDKYLTGTAVGDAAAVCSSGGGSWQMHGHNSFGQHHHGFVPGVVSAGGIDVAPGSPAWSSYSVSQGGVSLEEMTSRICEQYTETLLRKLEERRHHKQEGPKHSPAKQQRHQQGQKQVQEHSNQQQQQAQLQKQQQQQQADLAR